MPLQVKLVVVGIALLAPTVAGTQTPRSPDQPAGNAEAVLPDTSASNAVTASMSGALVQGTHLELTPVRARTKADEARAAQVLAELRSGIARYADYRVAEADGYKQFLPKVPQAVYHFTNYRRSVSEAFAFDAARPSSLLYEKSVDGYKLVGAMYHAPRRASLDQLDERIPLSIARWHRHVKLCFPARGDTGRWHETRSGVALFGPRGSIATQEDCDASGGRFVENLFGWMVHVNAFARDTNDVWGSEGSSHDHGSAGH
ncbi:MAG: hypothetical protein H7Z74_18385 [Anaerolineae bacterium]|nr:hypothetical protein [Gemmatimonadaceae bacterium]